MKKKSSANEKEKLSGIDGWGIFVFCLLSLIFIVDMVDLFNSTYIYENFRNLFFFINIIELSSWLLIVPVAFIFLLVKLIVSIKNKKKVGAMTCISLFFSLIVGPVTLGVYAGKF